MRAAAIMAMLAIAAGACARPMPPPGGEQDRMPPRLIGTTPEPLAIVPPGPQPVVFRFDERLSERGFSEALVTVSPQDGALRVERGRTEVRVRIDGGWRANRVYRVVLLPGVRDLFGNARDEQVELVFSTGIEVPNSAFAGVVLDRVTGAPARTGVVRARHRTEDAVYAAIADTSGFFSLRHLPVGEYDVHAFDDQNRNRRRDPLEAVDSGHVAVIATPTDTVTRVFHVLSPDTTAPRVARADRVDSLHVRVTFDDWFDPATGLAGAGAEVHALPDSTRAAGAIELIPGPVFAERAAAAAADEAPPAAARPAGGPPLPTREAVVRLDRVLPPGTYVITIGGVRNLHDLVGGGTARFEVPEPEPEPVPDPPGDP